MNARTIAALLGVALLCSSSAAVAGTSSGEAKTDQRVEVAGQDGAETLKKAKDKMQTGIEIGDTAPMADVKMPGIDGKKLSIADAAGKKGTLVIFTCNSCPWVKAWQSRTVAIGNRFMKQGIGVIAVNANDPDVRDVDGMSGMKERAKSSGMKYAYVMDETSDIARAFGATRTPEAFLFDADGKLVYHGAIDDNAHKKEEVKEHYLETALEAVSAGKPVKMAETKALGCTIKFRKEA